MLLADDSLRRRWRLEYFGFMWPNNAAAGVRYGAVLDGLGMNTLRPRPLRQVHPASIFTRTSVHSLLLTKLRTAVNP